MQETDRTLSAVSFTQITLDDVFWRPRVETNRTTTIPIQYHHLKDTGRIDGIDPDYKTGDVQAHHIFWDSDIAKWIETASYSLQVYADEELSARLDAVIAQYAKLQRPDGYINSWYTAVEPEKRWSNLRDNHELYCAGHLMEAAAAHYQATGKRNLLDIMCRYADYIDTVFGPEQGKKQGYPGHEEIELALIKLYAVTGEERYRSLAEFFVNQRGKTPHYFDQEAQARGEEPKSGSHRAYEYNQSHVPVRKQTRVVGHAVRAMYLYCAMADVARETGDESLVEASETLWRNVCQKQMYITGGIGPSRHNEGFTFDYDLPEETAYCETCAAIGLVFWNHRLLQLHGDRKYADVMERALYNGCLSGISLSGDKFFYVNPLASLGQHHREPWFGCACCPGNISRLIASVGQYMYSQTQNSAWVHLYVQGGGTLDVGGQKVHLEQQTRYPWDGHVVLTVKPEQASLFTLALRIPGWCSQARLSVQGEPVDLDTVIERGYAKITREWAPGDTVELHLSMPVQQVTAHPQVRMLNGKTALQRGPIVYCLEEVDNPVVPLTRIVFGPDIDAKVTFEADLLGGVSVITGQAFAIDDAHWGEEIYQTTPVQVKPCAFRAVPYSVWDNRTPGQMRVWFAQANAVGDLLG